jgi:hypothetical protein
VENRWLKRVKKILNLGLRSGQFAGSDGVGEPGSGVRAVAKRLVGALSAAAEGDYRTSGQAEGGPAGVEDLKFALNAAGPLFRTATLVGIKGMVARAAQAT